MPPELLRQPRHPETGYTAITTIQDQSFPTGMDFGILRIRAGASHRFQPGFETACLLLDGHVELRAGSARQRAERGDLFHQDPVALHADSSTPAVIHALTHSELAVLRSENPARFTPLIFDSSTMAESGYRDRGKLDDTACRIVRTIFDLRNRPEASLVLGEVVNFPGRWSSYPPHHHPQPEIYHYRFSKPQGYGHCELGERVFKVYHGDTVRILQGNTHSQVAAPGYSMYYMWAIRHLPGRPYTVPTFVPEHRWMMDPAPGATTGSGLG